MTDPDIWKAGAQSITEFLFRKELEINLLRTALEKITHIADDEITLGCGGFDHVQMHLAIEIARQALSTKITLKTD